MLFLLALSTAGAALGTGGILWMFRAIPSLAVFIVIGGAGWGGFAASNWLHVNAAGAVNRLLVGLAGPIALTDWSGGSCRRTPNLVDFKGPFC